MEILRICFRNPESQLGDGRPESHTHCIRPTQLYSVQFTSYDCLHAGDIILGGFRAKGVLKGPEDVLRGYLRAVMELHTLSYGKSSGQTIVREAPLLGYT